MCYHQEYISKERVPLPELPSELLSGFKTAFFGREDCYPLQRPNGAYLSVKEPLTPHLIKAHLQGQITLGAYALDTHNQARWLCFDADEIEQWMALRDMAWQLEREGVFPYLELSRRGGHCWLFFEPLPGETVRRFGKQLLEQYKIGKLELYPKQDVLTTGTGSLVRLPFGIHRKTGNRYSFITAEGQPLAPTLRQQLALLAVPAQVPHAFVEQTLANVPASPPTGKANVRQNDGSNRRISV